MVLPLFRNDINFSKSCVLHLTRNFLQPMFGRAGFKSWCWQVEEEFKLVEWGREELVSVCTRHRIRLLVTYCSSGFVYIHRFILLVGVCVSTASFSDAQYRLVISQLLVALLKIFNCPRHLGHTFDRWRTLADAASDSLELPARNAWICNSQTRSYE